MSECQAYDALGRLATLISSDGTVSYAYSYDLNNNPIEVKDEVSGLTSLYTYDRWNRTLTDGIKDIVAQSFSYDALGRLTGITAPDNSLVAYTYQESHLSSISWRGLEHSYTAFDMQGRPQKSMLMGKAGAHEQTWDKKGRLTNIAHAHYAHTVASDGFDAVGNLKKHSFTDPVGHIESTFEYDDLYQLTSESGVQTHSYSNDSISNRLAKNNGSYTLDSANKLLNTSENAFVYDKNGNLIEQRSPKKTLKLAYDALDRLISVDDGIHHTTYIYDNLHRRIARSMDAEAPKYFLHLGQREVGLWDAFKNELQEYRVLGLGKGAEIGASVTIELKGNLYCPLHDNRGNIISLVDVATGDIAESYRYTAYGEQEVYTQHQQKIEKSALNNPWGFMSKRLDSETGFVYFSRRYYAPLTGRWITPDPLGFADGPNVYAYVHGNPMTKFDLYGLSTKAKTLSEQYQKVSTELSELKNYEAGLKQKVKSDTPKTEETKDEQPLPEVRSKVSPITAKIKAGIQKICNALGIINKKELNEKVTNFSRTDEFSEADLKDDTRSGKPLFGMAKEIKDLKINKLTQSLARLLDATRLR